MFGSNHQEFASLDEMKLISLLHKLETLNDESISFDEALDRSDALVADVGNQ